MSDKLGKDKPQGKTPDLEEINFSQLIGRKHFTVLYIVSRNRYRVNTAALINTRVNSFTFINTTYANNVTKFLNIKAT